MKAALSFLLLVSTVSGISLPGTWGYEVANSTYDVNYFYWFFEPANPTPDAPLVLWLTGGPGCSSELALFFENGPYQVNKGGDNIIPNKFGWNQNNYLLYVDQPGGTGFSTVGSTLGYVADEAQVAGDMLTFLNNFFQTYPKLAVLDFFIFGESFAGHYVPAIGAYLVQNAPHINLAGVAIGNGLVDPYLQTASFGPFIYGHGLMTKSQLDQVQAGVPQCQQDINNGEWSTAFQDCGTVLNDAMNFCAQNKGATCNIYDILAPCDGPLCYDFDNVVKFLNSASVQKTLNVTGINWQACDTTPYQHLEGDFERSYQFDIPIILAHNVPVTVYNGDLDIICNFYGESDVVNTIQWPGASAFAAAANTTWSVGSSAAGNYRTAEGLTYVVVYNAGHMVPHDQPAAALNLMQTVLKNAW